ncbi:ABC transporter ATP-binding protein [Tautonia sociabilis]|uniref:ABC transporter ATP-binding protein n=1 Tax=Tautonia sociabilis TaxID=2080755 RepID=A0A432MFN8_9BACT|nr:ABC transporter ATP-binding protein [Tautonia sociabilis]RUL85007.1 ABC transporter ATP-binding protein [Tautonia sociabilis]
MNASPPAGAGVSALELIEVSRRYPEGGGVEAIDLEVPRGERLAVVGPSGSGKTTLLRLIAGLERPDGGAIRIDGTPANERPPRRRGLAMVFQEQPPYPHLDVAGNLAFGLKARGRAREEIQGRVREVADRLGIGGMLSRRPAQLSGGERRRVVLGRALATGAGIVLLDEPFSALDPPLRSALRADLIAWQERQGGTIVLVSHDQAEAMAFGHRLAVIRGGHLLQIGAPAEVYARPSHRFVAEFVGDPGASVIRCRIRVDPDAGRIDGLLPGASWTVPRGTPWMEALAGRPRREVDLALRPEHVEPITTEASADSPSLVGRVEGVEPRGFLRLVSARVGEHRLRFWSRPADGPEPGDRVPLRLRLRDASWFDPDTGEEIRTGG